MALAFFADSGDAFSVYLTDIHDGNSGDDLTIVTQGIKVPYDQVLINLHQGYDPSTGTKYIL